MGERHDHKKYSPSQIERIALCPGSVEQIERSPSRATSTYALEGTLAHNILEAGIKSGASDFRGAWKAADCPPLKNHGGGHFAGAINDALDYLHSVYIELDTVYGDVEMYSEIFVDPPNTVAKGEAGGYVDVVILSRKAKEAYIIDYKHGAGYNVPAEGNKQVKGYGLGLLFGENNFLDPNDFDVVNLVIIQPRSYHPLGEIREEQLTTSELYAYLFELEEILEKATDPTAPLLPGPKQCMFCDALSTCPAVRAKLMTVANPSIENLGELTQEKLPDPGEATLQELAYYVQVMDLYKKWAKAVDDHVKELLMSGHQVPGRKLVNTKTQRKWYGKPQEVAIALAAEIGCSSDDLITRELIPMTEAEKKIIAAYKRRAAKGKRRQASSTAKKAFAYFTTKEASNKLTVASSDDSRPAVNPAENVFGDLGQTIQNLKGD